MVWCSACWCLGHKSLVIGYHSHGNRYILKCFLSLNYSLVTAQCSTLTAQCSYDNTPPLFSTNIIMFLIRIPSTLPQDFATRVSYKKKCLPTSSFFEASACTIDETTKRCSIHDIQDHHENAPANSASLTPYNFWISSQIIFVITKKCILVLRKIEALGASWSGHKGGGKRTATKHNNNNCTNQLVHLVLSINFCFRNEKSMSINLIILVYPRIVNMLRQQ